MTSKEILARFRKIRIGRSRNRRAPHKPLLVLWAVGRCLEGKKRLAAFSLIESELTRLLKRFGPHNGHPRPVYPFWRLQNDKIWEIDRPHLVGTTSRGDARRTDLFLHDIHGGFRRDCYDRLQAEPALAFEIAMSLLHSHFPETLHQDILDAVGIANALDFLEIETRRYGTVKLRQGQAAFRKSVLGAYERQCAVCALSVRVQGELVAVEAAHIRWDSSKGPANVENGLALCALHHKFFDYGAFTALSNFNVFVSQSAEGRGADETLSRYHGESLLVIPNKVEEYPSDTHLAWRHKEVFRTPHELSHAVF